MAANRPLVALAKQPRNPISRRRIETVASRSVAIYGLVFGAQTLPMALAQIGQVQPGWAWLFLVVVYAGLLAAVVASMARRFVRFANAFIASAFLTALVAWPLIALDPVSVAPGRPWLWFLCTVATASAAIAFSTRVAAGYLVLVPAAYGVVRVLPSGGGQSVPSALLDVAYAIILGGAVQLIITLLRQASSAVDTAQSAALDRYSYAVRQHATELERGQVDAIVHDSVLTTLLSAARAYTPEAMALVTVMADNAMGHLKDAASASPDSDTAERLDQLAQRIVDASLTLTRPFDVRSSGVDVGPIPRKSAEAVYSAAVQAMVNSIQHAGEGKIRRWLAVSSAAGGQIRVEVGDAGSGFVVDRVPTERLGLRISIFERVVRAGGRVEIDSLPGSGTRITIDWPVQDPDIMVTP